MQFEIKFYLVRGGASGANLVKSGTKSQLIVRLFERMGVPQPVNVPPEILLAIQCALNYPSNPQYPMCRAEM